MDRSPVPVSQILHNKARTGLANKVPGVGVGGKEIADSYIVQYFIPENAYCVPAQSYAGHKGFLDLKKLRVRLGNEVQVVEKLSSRAVHETREPKVSEGHVAQGHSWAVGQTTLTLRTWPATSWLCDLFIRLLPLSVHLLLLHLK